VAECRLQRASGEQPSDRWRRRRVVGRVGRAGQTKAKERRAAQQPSISTSLGSTAAVGAGNHPSLHGAMRGCLDASCTRPIPSIPSHRSHPTGRLTGVGLIRHRHGQQRTGPTGLGMVAGPSQSTGGAKRAAPRSLGKQAGSMHGAARRRGVEASRRQGVDTCLPNVPTPGARARARARARAQKCVWGPGQHRLAWHSMVIISHTAYGAYDAMSWPWLPGWQRRGTVARGTGRPRRNRYLCDSRPASLGLRCCGLRCCCGAGVRVWVWVLAGWLALAGSGWLAVNAPPDALLAHPRAPACSHPAATLLLPASRLLRAVPPPLSHALTHVLSRAHTQCPRLPLPTDLLPAARCSLLALVHSLPLSRSAALPLSSSSPSSSSSPFDLDPRPSLSRLPTPSQRPARLPPRQPRPQVPSAVFIPSLPLAIAALTAPAFLAGPLAL
jgi:hypothetical protein